MERRELLKTAALLCGSAATGVLLSTPSLAITNAFQQASANAGHSLNLLNTVQLETLRRICELTIPATDTPSATQVNCHFFIDAQLSSVFDTQTQHAAVTLLDALDNHAVHQHKQGFSQLNETAQLALLTKLEVASAPFSVIQKDAFKVLKGLIVFGYYTSQPGATKELTYLAVPGRFVGSVKLSKIGSAYSSKAYY